MTNAYERSSAGAVMLKIATMVCVEPMPMRLRQHANATINHTALMGVFVILFTFAKNGENGRAPSRANAYAMRVSANMAEQPVKNCTRMTKNHITLPPLWPPALRKI